MTNTLARRTVLTNYLLVLLRGDGIAVIPAYVVLHLLA